jgi:hypothetical protein
MSNSWNLKSCHDSKSPRANWIFLSSFFRVNHEDGRIICSTWLCPRWVYSHHYPLISVSVWKWVLEWIMCTHVKPQCVSSRVKPANWSFENRIRNSSPKLKRIAWLSHLPLQKISLLRVFLRSRTGMQLNMSICYWYNCLQLHHNCWNMILILNKFLVEPGSQYLPEARGRISMTGFMVSRSKMINLVGLWLFSGGPHRPARTGLNYTPHFH